MGKNELDMEKNLIIRHANIDDADNMLNYIKDISGETDFLTFGPNDIKVTVDQEKDFIKNANDGDTDLFIIAELDGKIIGNLNFQGNTKPRLRHRGEFGISVSNKYWGMGVGTLLLDFLLGWVKEKKVITKIDLTVRKDNINAIRLYKKFGFKKEGEISRFFYIDEKYYDSVYMGLEL